MHLTKNDSERNIIVCISFPYRNTCDVRGLAHEVAVHLTNNDG